MSTPLLHLVVTGLFKNQGKYFSQKGVVGLPYHMCMYINDSSRSYILGNNDFELENYQSRH